MAQGGDAADSLAVSTSRRKKFTNCSGVKVKIRLMHSFVFSVVVLNAVTVRRSTHLGRDLGLLPTRERLTVQISKWPIL
jgi:hypothetical protein